MSIPESSITTFLDLAGHLGVRGLEAGGQPSSQKIHHIDAGSMMKVNTGCKTFGEGETDHVTLSESGGEPSDQCDATKKKGEVKNKTDANKKPWIQADHFLGNLSG